MAASGQAFFCRRGHLYRRIEYAPFVSPERKSDTLCPCGEKSTVVITHYGRLDDCLPAHDANVKYLGEEHVRVLERIPDALDADGNPIDAYRAVQKTLAVCDVSGLVFPDPA